MRIEENKNPNETTYGDLPNGGAFEWDTEKYIKPSFVTMEEEWPSN